MAKLQISLVKDSGMIRVYAAYNQSQPVFLERVNLLECDSAGSTISAFTTVVRDYFGPGQGSNLLFSHAPSGANVKQVKATGFYINIDQVAASNTVAL